MPPRVATRIDESSDGTIMPTTSSSPLRRIPFTPRATRPMGRTSDSRKRMAWPARVARRTSLAPSVICTSISSSSSSTRMAWMPTMRTLP